jgi:hypothetical protein
MYYTRFARKQKMRRRQQHQQEMRRRQQYQQEMRKGHSHQQEAATPTGGSSTNRR